MLSSPVFVGLYVCVFVCLYVCVFVYLYVCELLCFFIGIFVLLYICVSLYFYTCFCVFVSAHVLIKKNIFWRSQKIRDIYGNL